MLIIPIKFILKVPANLLFPWRLGLDDDVYGFWEANKETDLTPESTDKNADFHLTEKRSFYSTLRDFTVSVFSCDPN